MRLVLAIALTLMGLLLSACPLCGCSPARREYRGMVYGHVQDLSGTASAGARISIRGYAGTCASASAQLIHASDHLTSAPGGYRALVASGYYRDPISGGVSCVRATAQALGARSDSITAPGVDLRLVDADLPDSVRVDLIFPR